MSAPERRGHGREANRTDWSDDDLYTKEERRDHRLPVTFIVLLVTFLAARATGILTWLLRL